MHTSPHNFLECFAMTMPSALRNHLLKQPLNLALCHSGRDKLQDTEECVKTARRDYSRLSRSILSLLCSTEKVDFTWRERNSRCGPKHGGRNCWFPHEPDEIFRRGSDYWVSSRVCTAGGVPGRLQRRSSANL